MPDAGPMESVGYLIAAAVATVIGLVGYTLMLMSWIRAARARNDRLRSEAASGPPR